MCCEEMVLGLLSLLLSQFFLFHQFILSVCQFFGLLLQVVLFSLVLFAHVPQDAQSDYLLQNVLHLFVLQQQGAVGIQSRLLFFQSKQQVLLLLQFQLQFFVAPEPFLLLL